MAASAIDRDEQLRNRTIAYLLERYAPSGNRIGWLMIASIFIESWDLYSISFCNVFLKDIYHPSASLLGLTSAATQAGAIVGALVGGKLSDHFGRRPVFMATMVVFVVFGLAQAFAPNMVVLAAIRFFLGIPLGSDVANGYSYIMESMPKGKREVMGNRWQIMFAAGEIAAALTVALFYWIGIDEHLIWRLVLGLGALPALALVVLRRDIPETAIWLVEKGRYADAKKSAQIAYGDSLDMLPDENRGIATPTTGEFFKQMWPDETQRRGTLFGWIAGAMQSLEFATFGFYLPIMLVLVGVSGILGTMLMTAALYVVAIISAMIGPRITPRIGQRGLSIWGFGTVFVSLLVVGYAIHANIKWLVPIAAAGMLWGHYWDSENTMTIPSMVAPPRYRGIASGTAYLWVKASGFLGIYLFPSFFGRLGQANATFFTSIFALIGLLAAIFILREVYGHTEVRADDAYPSGAEAASHADSDAGSVSRDRRS